MEHYPDLTKVQRMVAFFYEQLESAYEQGDSDLVLMMVRGGGSAGVSVQNGGRVDVAEELGMRGGEVVGLLRRLDSEGYLRLNYGQSGRNVDIPIASMDHIPDRGLLEIGMLPSPDERFAAAFEAAREHIERDSDMPEPRRRTALDTLDKMVALARSAHGIGDLLQRTLGG